MPDMTPDLEAIRLGLRESVTHLGFSPAPSWGDVRTLLAHIEALQEALAAAYPILCGIVNEHHLDPEDARYVSDGWRVKELVRTLLKGRAAELAPEEKL